MLKFYPKSMLLFWFSVANCIAGIKSSADVNQTSTVGPVDPSVAINDTIRVKIGSMLNVSCSVNDECILKNSYCSPLTRRCECDPQTMENGSVCQVIYCSSTSECQQRFANTVCNYGHCQCQFGLIANGQCVSAAIPGGDPSQAGSLAEIISKLPAWSFPIILVGAVLSGALGSRSPLFAQIFHHIFAIVVLVSGAVKRASTAGTSIPAEVVAEVVEELVDIPVDRHRRSSSVMQQKSNQKPTSNGGGLVESCHHVHEIQLNCDPVQNI